MGISWILDQLWPNPIYNHVTYERVSTVPFTHYLSLSLISSHQYSNCSIKTLNKLRVAEQLSLSSVIEQS